MPFCTLFLLINRFWRSSYISTYRPARLLPLTCLYCSTFWMCPGLSSLSVPFWWTFRLFPVFCYFKQGCREQLCTWVISHMPLSVGTSQKWSCWVKGHAQFNFSSCKNNACLLYKFQTTLELIGQKAKAALPTTPILPLLQLPPLSVHFLLGPWSAGLRAFPA